MPIAKPPCHHARAGDGTSKGARAAAQSNAADTGRRHRMSKDLIIICTERRK
jgi:hypothetical protein